MLPVSVLPVCGLLMGIGYLLCPGAMQENKEIVGTAGSIGYFLVRAGGSLIEHIALLFAIGVGVGMSEKNDGTGAIAALVSWLMVSTLLSVKTVGIVIPSLAEDSRIAFENIENPFIGILTGIIGATCYNRFHRVRLPEWLSFFSGKRAVAIIAGVVSIVVSFVLLIVWPLIFSGLTALGHGIEQMGPAGAALYAFLNRLLIPFGLHHALNNVFWFETIGLGDLKLFWAGKESADVSWSLGMYMSGFFPCMMFGVPGAALAMIRSAKPARKKAAMGILVSSAVCAFVCGVTEPFEFAFMFLCPVLYAAYALLYGIITFLTVISGFRAGFCFSAGAIDLIFSQSLPAATKTWLIIPLGALSFVVFYGVFRFMITRWNLKTPGREEDGAAPAAETSVSALSGSKYAVMAETILRGLGGAENVQSLDHCITRLRLEIRDPEKVDEAVIRSAGVAGVIRTGKDTVQVVIGTTVQFVADEMKALCNVPVEVKSGAEEAEPTNGQEMTVPIAEAGSHRRVMIQDPILDALPAGDEIRSPAEGELIPMEEIPDPVFSEGVMGGCVGIMPANGSIYAPVSGMVTTVVHTGHAVSFRTKNGEEILVHAGLDTVKLNGEGFEVLVREGDEVIQGQPVMKADLDLIRTRGYNPIIIVVRVEQ